MARRPDQWNPRALVKPPAQRAQWREGRRGKLSGAQCIPLPSPFLLTRSSLVSGLNFQEPSTPKAAIRPEPLQLLFDVLFVFVTGLENNGQKWGNFSF